MISLISLPCDASVCATFNLHSHDMISATSECPTPTLYTVLSQNKVYRHFLCSTQDHNTIFLQRKRILSFQMCSYRILVPNLLGIRLATRVYNIKANKTQHPLQPHPSHDPLVDNRIWSPSPPSSSSLPFLSSTLPQSRPSPRYDTSSLPSRVDFLSHAKAPSPGLSILFGDP